MIRFSSLLQPDRGQTAHLIRTVTKDGFEGWVSSLPARERATLEAAQFKGKPGDFALLPASSNDGFSAAVGLPEQPTPWDLAAAAQKLPPGTYRLADGAPGDGALGWLLAHYRFDHYRSKPEPLPERVLLTSEVAQIDQVVRIAEAVSLVRDLVNTPAADLGPDEFATTIEKSVAPFKPTFAVHAGADLDVHFPCIAAVGRAAAQGREPRLVEVEWGDENHPRVAVIGKGVCFDSGGLDIKPSSSMLLMKKDMGGAAHALALAQLIMAAKLPVRLHLVIPLVENAVGSAAFRPGDILRSRQGLTVEIGNTDAEGRLILADALTFAAEKEPVLILDYATLTGAARVALGPELPALFSNDDTLAADLLAAGTTVHDPLWRMPLWSNYADMLKSEIADMNNAGEGGMAGAVTAALFLQKFVPDTMPWAHLDTFAWMPSAKPGRPKGGEALGLRAAWQMLRSRFA